MANPLEWGCPPCRFWLAPSTLPTNYRECPLCHGPFISREPKPPPPKPTRGAKADHKPTPKLMPD